MDSHANHLIFSMPLGSTCRWSSVFFYSDIGIFILVPFIVIPSMTAINLWNTSMDALLFGLLLLLIVSHAMHSLTTHICAHHLWLPTIYVMWSGMSMHVSVTLILLPILGISSSLFTSWLCQDSQSSMNSCSPGFLQDPYVVLMDV